MAAAARRLKNCPEPFCQPHLPSLRPLRSVLILEDDDVAHVACGGYSIYNARGADVEQAVPRVLQTLQMEVEQIRKARYALCQHLCLLWPLAAGVHCGCCVSCNDDRSAQAQRLHCSQTVSAVRRAGMSTTC